MVIVRYIAKSLDQTVVCFICLLFYCWFLFCCWFCSIY